MSNVWFELIKGIQTNKNFETIFIEHKNDQSNVYWRNFPKYGLNIIKHNINLHLARVFSPFLKERNKFIYFTSEYDICSNSNAINVIIVHDFIYEIFGKFKLGTLFNKWIKKRAILNADIIFCVSENTKKDLIFRYPQIEREKRIIVVHNGVSKDFFPINSVEVFENYVLFIGRRSSYKNFDKVINALQQYSELKLKIVSGAAPTETELIDLENKLGKARFEFLIGISNEELNILYNNAFCLAYPTEYEGFGIPILEAQRAGCPVITRKNSSIVEISGDEVIYLNDLSTDCFRKSFDKLKDPVERKKIVQGGLLNSEKYSWEKMAKEYESELTKYLEDGF